ncbi:MAG: hypothetical protein KIT19_08320 [Phycisphaeraceae bacterium]|nr:hypothetical protein [Phycisphaeraceae bacterium]
MLGKFGGYINRFTEGDVPEQLDTAGFEACMSEVYAKLNDLKSIPRGDVSRAEQRADVEQDQLDAAYGAMMEFIDRAAALASMARNPTPSGESAAGMNYGMAMVAWIDLRTVLTGSVRTVARACYAAGAPPIRLGRLRPSPSVIEAVADELGVVVRNAVYQDRPHPLDGEPSESSREVRDRLGVRTPLDGWILFQADWDALTPEKRAFALAMLKCSSIDHDDLRIMAMREAECAIREVVRRAERGFPGPADPPVRGSVGAKGGVVGGRDDAAMLAPCDLAELLGVEQRALEKRLERWRVTNVGSSDFVEVADRTPRQPKYLYRLRVAKQVSKGMKKQE